MHENGVFDVTLMHECFHGCDSPPEELPTHFEEAVPLGPGLWIGPLPTLGRQIVDACEPKGIGHRPTTHYSIDYGIWREATDGQQFKFDPGNRLLEALQLSRMVRPTSIGLHHAARVTIRDGAIAHLFAPGFDPSRYWVADESQNWLRNEDVDRVRRILETYNPIGYPDRIERAMWWHEVTHRQMFIRARWPMVVIGIDALVHVERHASTKQFTKRVRALDERGFVEVADWPDEGELEEIYSLRSQVTHRGAHPRVDPEAGAEAVAGEAARLDTYRRAELVLRSILISSIEHTQVRNIFESDAALKEALD